MSKHIHYVVGLREEDWTKDTTIINKKHVLTECFEDNKIQLKNPDGTLIAEYEEDKEAEAAVHKLLSRVLS